MNPANISRDDRRIGGVALLIADLAVKRISPQSSASPALSG